MAPHQANPLVVEVTSDGWVVLRPFIRLPDPSDEVPTSRLHAMPADVERWTSAARQLLALAADSSRREAQAELPALGRGRIRLAPYHMLARAKLILMHIVGCDGVMYSAELSQSQLDTLASALERATIVARRLGDRPTLPTLDRPYYQSEVSCAARRESDEPPPRFPSAMPRSARRYSEVGTRFIVDTSGLVEAGSVVVLSGVPSELARATRRIVEQWRYRPAEWSGLPVRQIVTTVVAFDPDEEATRRDSARVAALRERGAVLLDYRRLSAMMIRRDGGWVRVRDGRWRSDGHFEGHQEWFHPDSVDEWVARVRELIAADSAQPKRPPPPFGYSAIYVGPSPGGNQLGAQYQMGWTPGTERLKLVTLMRGCGARVIEPTLLDRRLLDQLIAAARSARRQRVSVPSEQRPYARGDVACASSLPPANLGRADMPGVWRYVRGPYPEALSRENIRAEVLSSFVVDSTGRPNAATLVVAPGSDPRAATALRQTIDRLRFRPAMRAGVAVPSLVIRTWLFEPPSTCDDERNGIDCARQYGKRP